jgi:urease accessory protein
MPSSICSPARCSLTAERFAQDGDGAIVPIEAPPRQLELQFVREPGGIGRTFARRQRVAYPFHLCRALYLPDDPPGFCTLYVQSCSGGLFQHDRLGVSVHAARDAHVHLTTAASTVCHTMEQGRAEHDVTIAADAGALVEYIPDPLILFPAAHVTSRIDLRVHRDATVIVADAFLAHDPKGAARPFTRLVSSLVLHDDGGRLLTADRFEVDGAVFAQPQVGLQGAATIQATLLVAHARDPAAVLDALRSVLPTPTAPVYAGASLLPNGAGAWLRALGTDAVALRALMRDGWAAVRTTLTGRAPGLRRK